MKFEKLNIISPLQKALDKEGFTDATEIQEKVIPLAVEGKDIIWCARTGSWKTLAFTLPILQSLYEQEKKREEEKVPYPSLSPQEEKGVATKEKNISEEEEEIRKKEERKEKKKKKKKKIIRKIKVLILAPTRELAIQIWETFAPYSTNVNMKHTVIYWWKSQFHQVKAIEKWIDILIATPWRLVDLIEQGFIKLSNIEYFVLDEADKMLDMWFSKDINKIIRLLPQSKQTLFFSATMPNKIKKLAEKILKEPEEITVNTVSSTNETIKQEVYHINNWNKRQLLQYLIKKPEYSSIIVFVKTKDDTEIVLEYVQSTGVECDNIHRNRSQNARQRVLKKLQNWEIKVLVATDIASRWIDIDDLSCVINYDLPQDNETYVHRIGRTARAGKNGIAISFCIEAQKWKLESIERLIWKEIDVVKDEKYKKEIISKKVFSVRDDRRKGGNGKKRYYWRGK